MAFQWERSLVTKDKSDTNLYVKEIMNFHIDLSTFLGKTALRL